jgi:hypothetical protein
MASPATARSGTGARRLPDADAVIDALGRDGPFPTHAVRESLARRDEIVPAFLDLLVEYAGDPDLLDDRADALFIILHILGEIGEKRAFAPLMDILLGDPERVEMILGDAITESLAQILIGVCDGDAAPLTRAINHASADEFVRNAAFDAWIYCVAAGHVSRTQAERYLADCFDTLEPRRDNHVWVGWSDAVAYLGFSNLRPLAEQVFAEGRVSYHSMDMAGFDRVLERRLSTSDEIEFLKAQRIHPFTNTIGTLSKWHGFSPEYLRKKRQEERGVQSWMTVENPMRHVGRNDPCPCGSGKKFKKCCLN